MEGQFSVVCHLYDLSGGLARNMSQMIIGKRIDGIWHTGIVVYGKEYYYGGGICNGRPGQTPYGRPIDTINLGVTELPEEVFVEFLNEIAPKFAPEKYDLFYNNCNNFSDECANFLLGTGIPKHIVDLPGQVLATPMGKQLMQMMGKSMDPRAVEGNNNPQQMDLNYGPGSHQLPSQPQAGGHTVNTAGSIPPQVNTASQGSSGGIQPVKELLSQADYNKEIQANAAVVIDVFTEWCGPCQAIKPFYAALPSQFPQIRFFKVEILLNYRWILRRIHFLVIS